MRRYTNLVVPVSSDEWSEIYDCNGVQCSVFLYGVIFYNRKFFCTSIHTKTNEIHSCDVGVFLGTLLVQLCCDYFYSVLPSCSNVLSFNVEKDSCERVPTTWTVDSTLHFTIINLIFLSFCATVYKHADQMNKVSE